jgi:hypothetical protein
VIRFLQQKSKEPIDMRTAVIVGWIIELAGISLWGYGYFVPGHTPLIDWHAHAPWWIANYLPNIESEIGAALTCVAMVPLNWPRR